MPEIGENFATTDPSEKVRGRAIHELSWMGATEALTRVLNSLDAAALEAALPLLIPETIPAMRERVVATNRSVLTNDTGALDRIRRLLKGVELGDTNTAADLVTELNRLAPPLDQHAEHAIREALMIVRKHDESWVDSWVAEKLLEGTLWGEHWQQFVTSLSQSQADILIARLAAQELSYREQFGIQITVSAGATPARAAQIFAQLTEVHRMAKATDSAPLAWKCVHQLQALFRTLPIEIAVSGITQFVSEEFAPESFQAAVEILGSASGHAPELRTELSDGARQFLRHYLSDGIAKVLANDLFDDETRAYAAIALARVGEANDLACLRSLIDADIRRLKPRTTNYSNWHVQALMTLEAPDVDAVLIDLLREQKYEGWAAQSLLQLVVPPNREKKPWLGNEIDYEAIWTSRAGTRPPEFDEGRARQYAQVIKQRLLELAGEHATAAVPEHFAGRLKSLAIALARLDGRDNADLILGILALPGWWDHLARMNGIRALLLSGATLTLDSMLTVLDPAIEHLLSQGLYRDQNLTVLSDCLELLLFSDDCAGAIARIEVVMSRYEHRPYQFRDLVVALGHSRSDAAVGFLLNLAQRSGGLQNMEDAWIEAVGRLDLPSSRRALLSFVDPQIPWIDANIRFDHRNAQRLVAYIAEWARHDPALKRRLLELSEAALTPVQKQLLPAIYGELNSDDAVLAGANMLQSTMSLYGMDRGLETLFVERRPYDGSGAFVFVPRNAEQVRAKLFQMILNDPTRRRAAFSILGQVEVWRIEYGRPPAEPRHPMIESGRPWPPISALR